MANEPSNALSMSDEDFEKLNGPEQLGIDPSATTETPEKVIETPDVVTSENEDEKTEVDAIPDGKAEEGSEAETGEAEAKPDEAQTEDKPVDGKTEDKPAEGKEPNADDKDKKPEGEEKPAEKPDFEAFYNEILGKPLKANGKEIELKSPDEVIKLMQQGANYTRKMQELAPHRKTLLLLQKENVTNDDLSFFIDLKNKNPDAIKRLIKDSGIDPLDIDTSSEDSYVAGTNQVTDVEERFYSKLEDVKSTEGGLETLQTINNTWDDFSKEALWNSPEIMTVIHEAKQTGVYDIIVAEVDRRITLGSIPANTPFLEAYQQVGNELVAQQGKAPSDTAVESGKAQPEVIATRAATPKPKASNGDKVDAASSTRTAPKTAKAVINPLAMSDEEFEKQANILEGRI